MVRGVKACETSERRRVWRGGSTMAAALTLQKENDIRDLYLFDTYAGMSAPTDSDVDHAGIPAMGRYVESAVGGQSQWCYASLEDVRANLAATGYPQDRCHFIKGDVLKTLPCEQPKEIAVLRLDTDWYESTLHELTHLYPKLSQRGIVIIDDYGHWQGCRKAVDEFFSKQGPFLCRIDYTGVAGVKLDPS